MSSGVVTPQVPNANDILLGEGTVYANYEEAGEAIIGATQSGSKFVIDIKTIDPKIDGVYGPVRDLKRIDKMIPHLIVNFLKLTYISLAYGVPCTVTDMGDYHQIDFNLNIEAADVLKNVAFIGQKHDGKACKIIVQNSLNVGNIDLNYKEKGEVTSEMDYEGLYAYATPTTPPFEIREYDV